MSQSIHILPYGLQMTDQNSYRKNDEIIIALSGPVVNIVLATIGVALWWYIPNLYYYLYDFVFSNFVLGTYNLVPIYPLDGGRVLLALCGDRHKKTVLKIMHIIAVVFAIMFLVLFVLTYKTSKNISYVLMSFFLLSTLFDKNKTRSNLTLGFENKSHIEIKSVIVNKSLSPSDMVRLIKGNYYYVFYVVDENFKIVKKISQTQLIDYMTNT